MIVHYLVTVWLLYRLMASGIFGMATVFVLLLMSAISRLIYLVYLHPLSCYPGPKSSAISPVPYLVWEIGGKSHYWVKALHDQYGDVVRIGPNILAYRTSDAWRDIYGHRKRGQKLFLKDPSLYTPTPNGVDAIITAKEADHTRMRRLLAHAFSRKALHEQESLLHTYADLLVQKLHEQIAVPSSESIDINRWFNFTTFDLIGDLAFGEPFNCLETNQYHWWVTLMFDAVRLSVYVKLLWYFPFLKMLLKLPLPQYLAERRKASFQLSVDKVNRRLQRQTDRPDFMSYILKHNDDEHGMSTEEIEANAATFVLAGSETTAALLSGCTYHLLKNPGTYSRLVNEVRTGFDRYSDIGLTSIANMPYLNAVLEESLRMYPPISTMLPRIVPDGGAMISGRFVPAGVSVSSSLWSTFHSSTNFTDPDSFHPERWLNDPVDPRFITDNRDAFQPFSYGPRNCLGQHLAHAEMRLILTKLLYTFDLDLDPESDQWAKQEMYNLWRRPQLKVRLSRAGDR